MKSIYRSILLYCCVSFCGQSNPSEEMAAILMEDVFLQEEQQHLKAHLDEKQKKEITLIGQARAVPIPTQKDSKVVQVVWTGVKSKDKKRASFKEPLISTFKSKKEILPKGLKISLYGDKACLSDAIERLEKGEDEQGSDELTAENPLSNERRLEDIEGQIKKHHLSRDLSDLDTSVEDRSSHDNASMTFLSESYRGNSPSSEEGKSAVSMIRQPSTPQNQLPGRRTGSSLRGNGRHAPYKKGYSSASPITSSSQSSFPVTPSSPQESGIQQAQKKPLIGEKTFPISSESSSETPPSLSHHPHKDFVERPNKEFNPLKINQKDALGGDQFKMPLIEVEVTKEGCPPRIDLERGKVIIQTRSIARTNGVVTDETQCADSHLVFDIKKDYGCCSDIIDQQAGVAYTTFKRYWLDDANNKIYLDEHCLKDESQPHPFIEEKGTCPHDIDLQLRLAYPQAETVYYDRSNARKLVNACHPTNHHPLSIILTEQGCSLKHLYEQNKSIIQKRDIFIENGITHEVTPCHETEETIPHQFVKAGCKPVINGSTVIPMARRQISYKDKTKIISQQCEPQDLTNLIFTKEGCEGQYEHDFESGRSYPLVRAYYMWGNKKRFIDKSCRRSDEALPHLLSIIGYEHLDQELKSKPRYQISIKGSKTLLIIKEFTEHDENRWLPYILSDEINRPSLTQSLFMDGNTFISPQDKVQLWTRPDGTIYEKVAGLSKSIIQQIPKPSVEPQTTIIKNSNTLIQNKPQSTVVQVTHEYANIPYQVKMGDRIKKMTYHYPGVRDVTHYSDGRKVYGPWRKNEK